jgi:hypothetical protein
LPGVLGISLDHSPLAESLRGLGSAKVLDSNQGQGGRRRSDPRRSEEPARRGALLRSKQVIFFELKGPGGELRFKLDYVR